MKIHPQFFEKSFWQTERHEWQNPRILKPPCFVKILSQSHDKNVINVDRPTTSNMDVQIVFHVWLSCCWCHAFCCAGLPSPSSSSCVPCRHVTNIQCGTLELANKLVAAKQHQAEQTAIIGASLQKVKFINWKTEKFPFKCDVVVLYSYNWLRQILFYLISLFLNAHWGGQGTLPYIQPKLA